MRSNSTFVSSSGRRLIRGQGMTEYIIILALIAVAAIAAVGFFGSAVKTQFVNLGSELIGEDSQAEVEEAPANTKASTLKNYRD